MKPRNDLVQSSSHRPRRERGARWQACELGLGTRVRCRHGVVIVERIRLEPLSATVTVFAGGYEVTFGWDELVEVVEP